MSDLFILLALLLSLIGGAATLLSRSVFDKLICLGILASGAILFMVDRGYLDVAVVVALMMPIGTLFILLLVGKNKKPEDAP